MTTEQLLQKYMPQIKEIAAYAASVGFDIENGNMDELMVNWLNWSNGLCMEILENKTDRAKEFRENVFQMAKKNICI